MKCCIVFLVCIQALALKTSAQCIPGIGPVITAPACVPGPFTYDGSVANSLADTLSLLTVSSLLAEKLPLGCCNCGCGCGCGNGCGCGYNCGCGYPCYL